VSDAFFERWAKFHADTPGDPKLSVTQGL
jgi:hypothetical protein